MLSGGLVSSVLFWDFWLVVVLFGCWLRCCGFVVLVCRLNGFVVRGFSCLGFSFGVGVALGIIGCGFRVGWGGSFLRWIGFMGGVFVVFPVVLCVDFGFGCW